MELTRKEKRDMPAYNYGHITEITPEEIRGMGATAVAVDIDNTSALFGSLRIASSRLGVPVEKIAMIGDKISMDVRSANKAGAIPVKVDPLSTDNSLLVGVAKYVSVAAVAAITLVKLR